MRVKEHEKEAADYAQRSKLDKKTISSLREVSHTRTHGRSGSGSCSSRIVLLV